MNLVEKGLQVRKSTRINFFCLFLLLKIPVGFLHFFFFTSSSLLLSGTDGLQGFPGNQGPKGWPGVPGEAGLSGKPGHPGQIGMF